MPTKVLIVDDDPAIREVLKMRLEQWGLEAVTAGSAEDAGRQIKSAAPDLVLSDVVMEEASGLDLLSRLQGDNPRLPIILVTAHGNVEMAVAAMKKGARDFLTKPIDYEKLKAVIDKVSDRLGLYRRTKKLQRKVARQGGFGHFIGNSTQMKQVYALLREVSATSATVLLSGESGTGKELAARTLHDLGPRAAGPFVAVNLAALPKDLVESELFGHEKGAFTGAADRRPGCFERADNGTLFLDEVAEMPFSLQPKLLRVLEEGSVRRLGGRQERALDVRLVSATNQAPEKAIEEKRLREDLYYRLNVFHVELPPLRSHTADIPLLVQHFVDVFNKKHDLEVEGAEDEVMAALKDYNWPGNVRELRNAIERAVILAKEDWIELRHLPPYLEDSVSRGQALVLPVGITAAEAERRLILNTLNQTGNNKAEAARLLGLDVKTIRNKLKSYE